LRVGGRRGDSSSPLSSPYPSVKFASQTGYSIKWHTFYDHTKMTITLMNGSRLSFISMTADQFKSQFGIRY
jgi:hypothetical protein